MPQVFILDFILVTIYAIYLIAQVIKWRGMRLIMHKVISDERLFKEVRRSIRWPVILISAFDLSILMFVVYRIIVLLQFNHLWVPTSWLLLSLFFAYSLFVVIRSSVSISVHFILKLKGL
jgi:hypothetical protein